MFEELENILKNNHNISECFKSIIESSEEATLTAKSSWELIVENIYGDILGEQKQVKWYLIVEENAERYIGIQKYKVRHQI